MVGLKQAAIAGVGIVALPAYVCRDEVAIRRAATRPAAWACWRFRADRVDSLSAGALALRGAPSLLTWRLNFRRPSCCKIARTAPLSGLTDH